MGKLYFVEPSMEIAKDIQQLKDAFVKNGEDIIHGAFMLNQMSVEEWIPYILQSRSEDTVRNDWVSHTTSIVFDDDGVAGVINMRHYLNASLRSYGGHIGYSVIPSKRRRGYAKEMVKHALEFYRLYTEEGKVMLSCNQDNIGSKKTILASGGVLEKEFLHDDGNLVEIYWITIHRK